MKLRTKITQSKVTVVTARYLLTYDVRIYVGNPYEIMVHHGSESCGVIIHHSHSPLGNSKSLTHLRFSVTLRALGSDMGPYPYSGSGYLPTSAIREMRSQGMAREGFRLGT
jgi:hypothetical protein